MHSNTHNETINVRKKKEIVELSKYGSISPYQVARQFNSRHPERQIVHSTVQRVITLLKTTGSLHRQKKNTDFALTNNVEFIEMVTNYIEANPRSSISYMALHFNCSTYSKVQKVVRKKLAFFPYKKQIHQQLNAGDPEIRLGFSRRMINWYSRDPNILKKILWSDEKQFTLTASFNRQNDKTVITFTVNIAMYSFPFSQDKKIIKKSIS